MLTTIVTGDVASISIGQRVQIHFAADDTVNGAYPVFRPIGAS